MIPERITDEEREMICITFKEGTLPWFEFKRVLDSERYAWAALEETQQQTKNLEYTIETLKFNRDSWEEAEKKAQGELAEAQQTISRQREALEFYAAVDTYRSVFNPPSLNGNAYTSFAPIVEDEGNKARAAIEKGETQP
jgi:hypothetical protein